MKNIYKSTYQYKILYNSLQTYALRQFMYGLYKNTLEKLNIKNHNHIKTFAVPIIQMECEQEKILQSINEKVKMTIQYLTYKNFRLLHGL